MKTRHDCKHYYWEHCHNPVVMSLFYKGYSPVCIEAEVCKFFEEGVPVVFGTASNEWVKNE